MKLWLTIYRSATAIFLVLALAGLFSLFLPKIRQYRARQRTAAKLDAELRMREEAVRQLQRQQELFASDPGFVEKIAREELGKARPGEIIFRFTGTNDPSGKDVAERHR
ncbi:MAG: septum formation initiator family protein [Kiritimatiellia bacterium]|nr:septum formation initiator family protein [Lentisphaerota bacterium]